MVRIELPTPGLWATSLPRNPWSTQTDNIVFTILAWISLFFSPAGGRGHQGHCGTPLIIQHSLSLANSSSYLQIDEMYPHRVSVSEA